jgi:hypothetical protein
VGYWRPTLAAFPEPPTVNTQHNQQLRKTDPAAFEKIQAEERRAAQEYQRQYGQYDEETIAAVDKFREDKGLSYAGNPPGLVDDRLVSALRSTYLQKKTPRP